MGIDAKRKNIYMSERLAKYIEKRSSETGMTQSGYIVSLIERDRARIDDDMDLSPREAYRRIRALVKAQKEDRDD